MLQGWLSNKVNRLRHRFDYHEMSSTEQSTSRATTSTNCTKTEETVDVIGTVEVNECNWTMTEESRDAIIRIIKERMSHTEYQYVDDDVPNSERCHFCMKRKGRWMGDDCSDHSSLCKHCCYEMIRDSIKDYKSGPLYARCPQCFRNISSLTRRKRRLTSEGHDENCPAPMVPMVNAEHSISLCDYTTSMMGGGQVNKGFESSSSL